MLGSVGGAAVAAVTRHSLGVGLFGETRGTDLPEEIVNGDITELDGAQSQVNGSRRESPVVMPVVRAM